MKKIFLMLLFILKSGIIFSQTGKSVDLHVHYTEKKFNSFKLNQSADLSSAPYYLLWFINPVIVYEDKHVDVGLTKEVSLFVTPVLRIAGEYSRIFRTHNKNHLRISANAELPIEAGDFAAFIYSIGAGYFSDFKHSGYFPQTAVYLFLASDHIGTNIYAKTRYTFITQKEKSNIFDISLGAGLVFYF